MPQQGILSWATSVRSAMVHDPCRQALEDQIQSQGFLFLDDYLDNILARAKRDPLIDLVKTPGRKRDAPKKTRAAIAAANAKSAVTLSLEDDTESKENQAPVNSFHQALLKAKETTTDESMHEAAHSQPKEVLPSRAPSAPPSSKQSVVTVIEYADDIDEDEKTVEDILSSSPPQSPARLPEVLESSNLLAPVAVDQANDLSMIAEDDEPAERSVQVLQPKSTSTRRPSNNRDEQIRTIDSQAEEPEPNMDIDEEQALDNENVISSSSSQTFHTVPLGSPTTQPLPMEKQPNIHSDYLTAPLPQISQSHSASVIPTENEAMTAPLPSSSSTPNIMSIPAKELPTQFPSLPAPSPLRKSMRVQREPSIGIGMGSVPPLPNAAPAAVGAGKRTSWLAKAKEVRALEVPGKRVSTLGNAALNPVPGMSGGVKRKSGDMLTTNVPGMAGVMALEDEERKRKVAKMNEFDVALAQAASQDTANMKDYGDLTLHSKGAQPSQIAFPTTSTDDTMSMAVDVQEGMMDKFKRTVEGLGARAGKSVSMSKSLGGPAAAAALAEARAAKVAAEARIAERDGRSTVPSPSTEAFPAVQRMATMESPPPQEVSMKPPPLPSKDHHSHQRKLSVSDLVTAFESKPSDKTKEVEKGFKPARASTKAKTHVGDESTSTTPPDSPPSTRNSNSSFVLPSGPVFNKPPVFVPPAVPPKDTTFSQPAASSLGVPARLPSPSHKMAPALSAQSTAASLFSDAVFDSQNDGPAWMPSTQDTEYSTAAESQSQGSRKIDDLDEDDSWPMVDEKLAAANPAWTPFGFTKEDSMTWSTLPTESQRDTRSTHTGASHDGELKESSVHNPAVSEPEDNGLGDERMDDGELDLEDLELEAGKSTVSLVKPKAPERSASQMSMASIASTSSSQSQVGWMGQATKLVTSVLGGSKNKKPQVPSLQRAAAAAKKEQEEKDKKAARMKEMENRRQLAIQRKADEEKSRAVEEEKKIREEGEKRKREREETTDKRPLKVAPKKVEEDPTKKRKVTVEAEKKAIESKKPPSKDTVAPSRMPQPAATSTAAKSNPLNKSTGFKPSASQALSSSATYNAQVAVGSTSHTKTAETKVVKTSMASKTSSLKGKSKAPVQDEDLSQPSLQLQTQMAARAKAQIQAAKQHPPEGTENIELPDINSEYSDSDDEDRPRTFDPPEWAQSPELRQQLQTLSTINPDDIFGPIRPFRLEEVFRTRQSRFRARTSSANWTGADRLTLEEERDYARRMGFR